MSNIVIIGGGIAALSAIKAIREFDKNIEVFMFSEEKFYPYNRIGLTKRLFGKIEEEDLLLNKKDWYLENKIDLNLGKKIIDIDLDKNEIILNDHKRIKFSKLLLANGASNFKPPIIGIDKPNVYSIRYLEDAWNIRKSSEDKSVILNIGGGILSLETAWELCKQKKKVIVVEILSRLMPRQLDIRASEILLNQIKKYNISVLLNTSVEQICGNNSVDKVITKDGNELNCEMVIYSAGIQANIEMLQNTHININRGVVVNERMQTNVENVYAAGDIAEYEGKIIGLWNIAAEQGKVAGYNIVGKDASYKAIIPVTTLNAFGISLFSMGEVNEENCNFSIVDDNVDANIYIRVFIEDCRIVGAIVIGDPKTSLLLRKAIELETTVNNIDWMRSSIEDLLEAIKR